MAPKLSEGLEHDLLELGTRRTAGIPLLRHVGVAPHNLVGVVVARTRLGLDRRRVLHVDRQCRPGEQLLAVLGDPRIADRGSFAGVVMAVKCDEHHRLFTLRLRNLAVVLRQPEHRRDTAGVVA